MTIETPYNLNDHCYATLFYNNQYVKIEGRIKHISISIMDENRILYHYMLDSLNEVLFDEVYNEVDADEMITKLNTKQNG